MLRGMRAVLLDLTVCGVAHAAPVAVATTPDGATLTLHDDAGPCVGGARFALWRSADAQASIPGCWVVLENMIRIAYFDGDIGNIAPSAFKKATSL